MQKNGFTVQAQNVADLASVKTEHQVPMELQSCHTAIVDGYVVEGHVPVAEINRLLSERPDIAGIAVPGMPIGSPGMEVAGYDPEPFDVIAFDHSGHRQVFASYDK
ncbi:MAG: DUF411 domain-containing protein [Caldilineaceae bacterium]